MLVPFVAAVAIAAPKPPVVRASTIQDSPIALTIGAPRGTARVTCSLDHARARTCTRAPTFKTKPGKHTVSVRAVDKRGRSSAARTVTVIVPSRAPGAVDVGGQPVGIAAANGLVWVSGGSSGIVSAIDASTKRVVASVQVGGQLGSV